MDLTKLQITITCVLAPYYHLVIIGDEWYSVSDYLYKKYLPKFQWRGIIPCIMPLLEGCAPAKNPLNLDSKPKWFRGFKIDKGLFPTDDLNTVYKVVKNLMKERKK